MFDVLFAGFTELLLQGGHQVAAEGIELRDGNEDGGPVVDQPAQFEGRVAQLGEGGLERSRHGGGILGGS